MKDSHEERLKHCMCHITSIIFCFCLLVQISETRAAPQPEIHCMIGSLPAFESSRFRIESLSQRVDSGVARDLLARFLSDPSVRVFALFLPEEPHREGKGTGGLVL